MLVVWHVFWTEKPPVSSPLGHMANVSASGALVHEQTERIQLSLSNGNLVNAENNREYSDISESSQLKALKLPDLQTAYKVVCLLYVECGTALLALTSNASFKLWRWQRNAHNSSEEFSASSIFQWRSVDGVHMSNDVNNSGPPEESVSCIALSRNECYLLSASGGKVTLFNMMRFEAFTTFPTPTPVVNYITFHPGDNNVIAFGMDDSSLIIYNVRCDEPMLELQGHQERITGLAFSLALNVLVSSGANAQLCAWDIQLWERNNTKFLQAPPGHTSPLVGETTVQFENEQSHHFLVIHKSQVAIYDGQLECLWLWYPRGDLSSPIMTGAYSCDGLLVFVGFCDGAIGIFDSDILRLRFRIAASAYMPSSIRNNNAFPVVIAAHPFEASQFALGMSDGAVYVIEPSETDVTFGNIEAQDSNESCTSSDASSCVLDDDHLSEASF